MTARVLIAEDEPHIAEALVFLLEREGYRVSLVVHGDAVIAAAADADLLLLDIMLPGRTGFEIAQTVRERLPDLKICVLTAKGQAADRERMETLGVHAFVTKPFSNSALMQTLRGMLTA